jgi:F420-non-reducing hydrogenase small subunit
MPKVVLNAVQTLLGSELPPRGSVLAPNVALCEECARKDTKPEKLSFTEFKRPHQVLIDEKLCLLAQGLMCMGPATRGGCEAVCIQGNMPCTGCGGPTSHVRDQGAKMLSALASLVEGKEPEEIERTLATIPDPVGLFYRYGLPASLLQAARQNETRAA